VTVDIEKLRQLAAAAARPAPWVYNPGAKMYGAIVSRDPDACDEFRREDPGACHAYGGAFVGESVTTRIAEFVCAMRNSIDSLLDELDMLRRVVNTLHAEAERGRQLAAYLRACDAAGHVERATNPANAENIRRLIVAVEAVP